MATALPLIFVLVTLKWRSFHCADETAVTEINQASSMDSLATAHSDIGAFKRGSLRKRVADLEANFAGLERSQCQAGLTSQSISTELLASALTIKRAASQIDEVVHALGILLALPHILEPDETVEALSLAAGNSGRPFDLVTSVRIAEYKFIDWKGGSETIRQNQLFKDFYELAEFETTKSRFLYVLGIERPLRFLKGGLKGGRALRSICSKNAALWQHFQGRYGSRFARVGEYYSYRKPLVNIVDLATILPQISGGFVDQT
jgi:hypothetical protein